MMEGITILSQSDVYSLTNIAVAHIFPGVVIAFLSLLMSLIFFDNHYTKTGLTFLLIGLAGVASFIAGFCMPQEFSHIQYKVSIDEEVNLIDFTNQYEIINQEGLIFTFKEKEN